MSRKEFLYAIKKDIEENLPLEAEYDNEEVPGLRIIPAKDIYEYIDFPYVYLGLDVLPNDLFEVYIRIDQDEYKNFGRVKSPTDVSDSILSYLDSRFNKKLAVLNRADFEYSRELKDFLRYNGLNFNSEKGYSYLYKDHSKYPITYSIDFSEHKGDVLIDIVQYILEEDGSKSDEIIYQSTIDRNTQKKVFSEILQLLKKELS